MLLSTGKVKERNEMNKRELLDRKQKEYQEYVEKEKAFIDYQGKREDQQRLMRKLHKEIVALTTELNNSV
jgi:hypothetical protein